MQNTYRTARRTLALALALAAAPAAAQNPPFSQTLFFGDSLTDAGFFRPALVRAAGPQAAILGKFTTNPGLVWSEHLANNYGSNAAPNGNGQSGNNYAAGGALVATDAVGALGPTPSLATQVRTYLGATGGRADPNALYSVWGGANDIFAAVAAPAQAQQLVGQAVTAQVGIVGALKAAGAQYVLVPTIPDIGNTPGFRAQGAAAQAAGTALANGYNQALFNGLASQGLSVIPVNTFGLLNEIMADPGRYGFGNVTGTACQPQITAQSVTCNPGTYATPNAPDTYLFADGVHPTSATHAIMAQAAQSMIEAPRQMALLSHSAVVIGRSRSDVVGAQAQSAIGVEDSGRWWADVRMDNQRYGPNNSADLYDGAGGTLTVGVDWTRGGLVYGAFGGYGQQNLDWGQSRGDFNQKDTTLGGYVGWSNGSAWVNGQLSYTKLDYDISRGIPLGPVTRVHDSSTDGRNLSAGVDAGWDFTRDKLTHGPILGLLAQWVDVDGFREGRTNESTSLAFEDQSFDSMIGSIGWQMRYRASEAFQPFARLTWEREFEDNAKYAYATAQSIPGSLRYAVPGIQFDDSYGQVTLGSRALLHGIELTSGASVTFGQKDSNDVSVFLSARRAF